MKYRIQYYDGDKTRSIDPIEAPGIGFSMGMEVFRMEADRETQTITVVMDTPPQSICRMPNGRLYVSRYWFIAAGYELVWQAEREPANVP